MNRLKIEDFNVSVDNKRILENVNIDAKQGDIIAIVGPNGVGKSTLFKAIMNHYSTSANGKIIFNDKDITKSKTQDKAKMGFYYGFQNPVELDGIKLLDLYKTIVDNQLNKKVELFKLYSEITPLFKFFNLDVEMLSRYNNVNFSGGQKKKNELIQMQLIKPKVILLDEIDSGSDVDTIKKIANLINQIKEYSIIFLISHQMQLIEKIKPNKVYVLANKKIIKQGNYETLVKTLKEGFSKYENKQEKDIFIDDLKNVF